MSIPDTRARSFHPHALEGSLGHAACGIYGRGEVITGGTWRRRTVQRRAAGIVVMSVRGGLPISPSCELNVARWRAAPTGDSDRQDWPRICAALHRAIEAPISNVISRYRGTMRPRLQGTCPRWRSRECRVLDCTSGSCAKSAPQRSAHEPTGYRRSNADIHAQWLYGLCSASPPAGRIRLVTVVR